MAQAFIEPGQIYGLITEVKKKAGALGKEKSQGINFPFRGIDGTINHLAPHLQEVGIITVPRLIEHELIKQEDAKKRIVTTSRVEVEYTFYAPDGSHVQATTAGEAQDYADRATAQSQSVAFRIALLQTFTLPTQSPEPEVTGQAAQDKQVSAVQQKLEKARTAATAQKTPEKSESDPKQSARDTVRIEWIESKKLHDDEEEGKKIVNALMKRVKDEDKTLKGDAVFVKILEKLSAGEVG